MPLRASRVIMKYVRYERRKSMKNEKMLMALTDNDIEFLPQTTKQKILNTVMPVLLPQNNVPQGRVKLPVRGMDDIMLTFVFCSEKSPYTPVTQSLIKVYDISQSELCKSMNENPCSYTLQTIDEMTGFPDKGFPIYVLTNPENFLGAGGIILPSVLTQLSDFFKQDFYILPSSIHEVIVIPVDRINYTPEQLARMVDNTNRYFVPKLELLSKHVYRANHKTHKITTIH